MWGTLKVTTSSFVRNAASRFCNTKDNLVGPHHLHGHMSPDIPVPALISLFQHECFVHYIMF